VERKIPKLFCSLFYDLEKKQNKTKTQTHKQTIFNRLTKIGNITPKTNKNIKTLAPQTAHTQ